jgi:hypothetical protein
MLSAQTIAATKPPSKIKLSPITQAEADAIAATVIWRTQVLRLENRRTTQLKNLFMVET